MLVKIAREVLEAAQVKKGQRIKSYLSKRNVAVLLVATKWSKTEISQRVALGAMR